MLSAVADVLAPGEGVRFDAAANSVGNAYLKISAEQ